MPEPVTPVVDSPEAAPPVTPPETPAFSWKSNLTEDYENSPVVQKYEDTKEGLNAAIRSTLDLTKMLGHEKVPIPKNAQDEAAWKLFKQAMKIPENADGYGLPDIEVPENLKGISFDKKSFAEAMHKQNATPE